ncbi:phosphate ABC transporter substrate-binding protein PstS [Dissulfurimicrobium hydrothermale]|uniref:phosphate ABC transporter substrate-binding protein PstS n=1 Tax=Dissulfurimicrobium hydrothermale TaxID=1750598 RepID=UPI0038B25648
MKMTTGSLRLYVRRLASISFLMVFLPFVAGFSQCLAETITGAGATFPYPIYSKWAAAYQEVSGVKLNYQSIGSGGGIQQIKARTVDFGASDAPLEPQELEAAGLVQFPMVMGGIVPVVNLKGVKANEIKLDGETLAKIYLGEIKTWNDPRIKALNPTVNLPSTAITVVHRADGSGTTWIFTHYLAAVSPEWGKAVGADKAVNWPVGLGGKGNEGVASYVNRVNGAIGYVEYAYALQNRLITVSLKNRDGHFVVADDQTFRAAAASADWKHAPVGMKVVLVNGPGAGSWPITGATFILMYKDQPNPVKARSVLKFFDWCYKNGGDMAKELIYIPMPDEAVKMVEDMWTKEIRSGGKAVWPAN